MQRRLFLKSAIASSAVATAVSAGLLTPNIVFANTAAFKTKSDSLSDSISNASKGLFNFKTPRIAENGAVVPVTVDASKMSDVSNIAISVRNNPTALSASFNLSGAVGFVSARVKMISTSSVTALVTAAGSTSVITKDIKVTAGGCGG